MYKKIGYYKRLCSGIALCYGLRNARYILLFALQGA